MNDTIPPAATERSPLQRSASDAAPGRTRRRALLTLLAVAVVLAVSYVELESWRKGRQQEELAASRAREAAEATARAQAAAQQAEAAQNKLAEFERSAAEAAAAAAATPVGPGRDDALLLEVERLVMLAMNDLQLTRQPGTAIAALELADARLAAAGDPRWAPLRRALGRDLERLRAVPPVDVTGIALKLDQLIAGADVWPLANAAAAPPPAPSKATPRPGGKKSEVAPPPAEPPPGAWQTLRGWLAAEFGDLVRINEVGTPEALLLDGEQGRLVRSQLKLRLLGARLSLLARNERLYQADIDSAQTMLALYFEGRHAGVAAASATLRQLRTAPLSPEVPVLADSQAGVRAARARR